MTKKRAIPMVWIQLITFTAIIVLMLSL